MFGCPRCGNDTVYLSDEIFSLLRCEFCGDDLDADVLLGDVDRLTHGCCPRPGGSCCHRWKQRVSDPLSAGPSSSSSACPQVGRCSKDQAGRTTRSAPDLRPGPLAGGGARLCRGW